MKKIYKIILLLLSFIFLTTYTPNKILFFKENKNFFFNIKNIEISNNKIIKKADIYEKLSKVYKKNILFISHDDIAAPLKNISFLEKIEVKKKYPSTILIKIYETKPKGVITKNNTKYIIDNYSNLIDINIYKDLINNKLPNIFGKDAEKDFVNFYKDLEKNDFPIKKIENFYYFQINRWDIQLFNNQIIKFPSKKREKSIKKSVELLSRDDFKKYKVIDLRIDGKIVVE